MSLWTRTTLPRIGILSVTLQGRVRSPHLSTMLPALKQIHLEICSWTRNAPLVNERVHSTQEKSSTCLRMMSILLNQKSIMSEVMEGVDMTWPYNSKRVSHFWTLNVVNVLGRKILPGGRSVQSRHKSSPVLSTRSTSLRISSTIGTIGCMRFVLCAREKYGERET